MLIYCEQGERIIETDNNVLIYNLQSIRSISIGNRKKFKSIPSPSGWFLINIVLLDFFSKKSIFYVMSQFIFLYKSMPEYNLQNLLVNAIIGQQNPIISLYILKKSIQQDLTREIQINSYLQNIAINQNPRKSKYQPKVSDIHKQITVENRTHRLISKLREKNPIRKFQNDTKNIPKNFGKAIITFVEQNQRVFKNFLSKQSVSYEMFLQTLRSRKRGINSIADLRNLWLDQQFLYAKQMRAISSYFLRRGSLSYVFNSRITNHKGHIKYRNRLIQVLKKPHQFTSIKTS